MLEVEYFQSQALVYDDELYKIPHPYGSSVTLRTIKESDAVLIMEMHDRLSKESVFYRYLGAYKPTIKDFQHLFSFDGEAGMAIVATTDYPHEKVIALAYYCVDPDDPSTAEPAILVEDNFQGCGLGKQILMALYQKAIQEGLTSFDTFIHPANNRALQLIRSSGLKYDCKYCDGMKRIRVWL